MAEEWADPARARPSTRLVAAIAGSHVILCSRTVSLSARRLHVYYTYAREFERRRGVSLRLVLTTDVTDVPFVCAVRAVAAGAGGANVYLF